MKFRVSTNGINFRVEKWREPFWPFWSGRWIPVRFECDGHRSTEFVDRDDAVAAKQQLEVKNNVEWKECEGLK